MLLLGAKHFLIDNIFVKNLEDNIISGNTISDLTDHSVAILSQKLSNNLSEKKLVRDYSNYSGTSFFCDLSQIDLIGASDVNKTMPGTSDVNKSFFSL